MTHIKINRSLFAALIASCIFVSFLTIHQTLADAGLYSSSTEVVSQNNGGENNQGNNIDDDCNLYSDEVCQEEEDLNSASEYSDNVLEKKEKYKEIFENILGKKIEKLSEEKLEKITAKLEKMLEKLENLDLEKPQFEKKLAQVLALLELFEETLEDKYEYSIDIDLEEIMAS